MKPIFKNYVDTVAEMKAYGSVKGKSGKKYNLSDTFPGNNVFIDGDKIWVCQYDEVGYKGDRELVAQDWK